MHFSKERAKLAVRCLTLAALGCTPSPLNLGKNKLPAATMVIRCGLPLRQDANHCHPRQVEVGMPLAPTQRQPSPCLTKHATQEVRSPIALTSWAGHAS